MILLTAPYGNSPSNLFQSPSLDGRHSKDPARQLLDETDLPVLEEFTLEHFDMLEGLLLVLLQPSNALLKLPNRFVPLGNSTLGIPLSKRRDRLSLPPLVRASRAFTILAILLSLAVAAIVIRSRWIWLCRGGRNRSPAGPCNCPPAIEVGDFHAEGFACRSGEAWSGR